MSFIYEDFFKNLQEGFIDESIQSTGEYIPKLLVNSKKDGIKFLSSIQNELTSCHEFWISVAFVTTSGVATLFNTLLELKERGIKGKLLVSSYLFFTQPEALRKLKHFDNIELKIAVNDNFHSKGYLFYNGYVYDLIIGSSNLTANALCSNKEWNLRISATPKSFIISSAIREFESEFEKATAVDSDFIYKYDTKYNENQIQQRIHKATDFQIIELNEVKPNLMQREALENIKLLRSENKNKALLISATGTGKTYLSAFDAKAFKPKRLLFVVHRHNIAESALISFKKVFAGTKTMSHYSSENPVATDFIFTTIQTLSRDEHLKQFSPDYFDYIVIDETHRAGADSYQKIINHFEPKFLLGMTATPERTDGYDIFELFDHNIAYEIRLHRALEEEMLSPFHYYGVTDITVNGKLLDDHAKFSLLASQERVNRIIETSELYGCDTGKVRGLVFCSSVKECVELSKAFNEIGYRTKALSGSSSEEVRMEAIESLETDFEEVRLDYIFTRDIFNEGINIPKVNQVIMLRPTQSAIVFVQQLGRGLRKTEGKEYLTVIDFIGNYSNNYLVPIALYGDMTYNKDVLRKHLSSGSNMIPGSSTINFDPITKERIFESINSANMHLLKDLKNDYRLLKYKLGRIPLMVDYLEHGSRDPQLYVKSSSRSYYNFVVSQEEALKSSLSESEVKLLELFSNEINNGKRVEESAILKLLLDKGKIDFNEVRGAIMSIFGYAPTDETIRSSLRNIEFEYITENKGSKKVSVKEKYGYQILNVDNDNIQFDDWFLTILKNEVFRNFLYDNVEYAIQTFKAAFDLEKFVNGFVLYRKYSRKDVFRILNWSQNPVAQTVGGYMMSRDKSNCPIFVNYHKEDTISNSTKYQDQFLSKTEFQWMTKSKRTLKSPEVLTIKNFKNGLRLPLFIKKHNDEGREFYYIGDLTPIDSGMSFVQDTMDDNKGKKVSVVKILFTINQQVEEVLYRYITNE